MSLKKMLLIGSITLSAIASWAGGQLVLQNGLNDYNGCKDASINANNNTAGTTEKNVQELNIYNVYAYGYSSGNGLCEEGNR